MEDLSIVLKIEEYCNFLDNKSAKSEDIHKMNQILSQYMTYENYNGLKILLYTSNSPKAKFYAANSLISIITQNYLSIPVADKEEMYDNLISYINSNCEQLFFQSRYLLKTLISLLCRIVRVSWLQSPKFKKIIVDSSKTFKEENTMSNILPFLVYSELIYQFQLPDLPPKNKQNRYIMDFKDYSLLHIYEFSTSSLLNIFDQRVKFENLEHYIYFIKEISRCLNECMEYEEDLNIKHENYKKFEIKPIYIPNNKKRTKDKTLDLDSLTLICKSLFDTHNIINRMIKENHMNLDKSDFCLSLLQKYCSIKINYLGEYKLHYLKTIQDGILQLIMFKEGLGDEKNLEEFCKLIFMLKKDFTVIELLENTNFIEVVYNFTIDCIQYCKILFNLLVPLSIPGLIYLFRFFGYFSNILAAHPIPNKVEMKNLLLQLFVNLFKQIYSYLDTLKEIEEVNEQINDLFTDLIDSVALLSRGIFLEVNIAFVELFENSIQAIQNEYDQNLNIVSSPKILAKINYLIFFSTAVISFNQKVILDKQFVEKVLDNDENLNLNLENINQNEEECEAVSQILSKIFKILHLYMNAIKINPSNETLGILKSGIFYFLKNFSKLFLSKKLSSKYTNIFQHLSEILQVNDKSMILKFIISILIELCKYCQDVNNKKDHRTIQNVIKIFQKIVANTYVDIDANTGERVLYVGKLILHDDFLKSISDLHEILVLLDPVTKGKYRTIFYKSICKIILMKESSNNNEIFTRLINYYRENIDVRKDYLNGNEAVGLCLLGYLQDLLGISASLNVKQDYKFFITNFYSSLLILKEFYMHNCHVQQVNISMLKLLENLTNNHPDRICFPVNSSLPVQLLTFTCDLMNIYKIYLSTLSIELKDDYLKHIKPVILILRIFKNFFCGKYIQFGSLITLNLPFIEDMFVNICELISSIKLENFVGHIAKTNVAYYLIKIIFCDYINYLDFQKFAKYLNPLMKFVEEGLEGLNNVSLIKTHDIILDWGRLFLENKKKKKTNQMMDSSDLNFIHFLFSTYEETFQIHLKKSLDKIFSGEITSFDGLSSSILALLIIYEAFYINLIYDLIRKHFKDETNIQRARSLAENLLKDVKDTLDDRNIEKFRRNLRDFSNEIQMISDN